MYRVIFSLSLVLFLLFSTHASSETRYVSDQLVITVREGKSTDSPRLTSLRTDTPLEILEEDDRFLKVRTQEGLEGYVQKQYITAERPKAEVIQNLQNEILKLKKQHQFLEGAKASLAGEEKSLKETIGRQEKTLNELRKELERITAEYEALKETSANVLNIVGERDRLESDNATIQQEIEKLREENTTLLRSGMIKWFLAGGSVFFVGWLSGKVSRKKRRF